MRESIGVPAMTNWVSMLRSGVKGAIVLVDDDDEGRFYENCCHESACLVPTPQVAREIWELSHQRGTQGVVALVRDTHEINGEGIFRPAIGDAISLLVRSHNLNKVMMQLGGADWLKACENERKSSFFKSIVTITWVLNRWGGKYLTDGKDYVNWAALDFSLTKIESELGAKISGEVARLLVEADQRSPEELLSQFDGKLALETIELVLKFYMPAGIKSRKETSVVHLLDMLIVSFDLVDIEIDEIFWEMREWERGNISFPLLRRWRQLDSLGMLLDQRYWESDLKKLIEKNHSNKGLSIFKMDLDDFKSVNTKLGHSGGDDAIRIACRVLSDCLAEFAELYRRGGDELVALAPGIRGENAALLGEKIRQEIELAMRSFGDERGLENSPTASIGVVDVPSGSDFHIVVQKVDEAQQRAKDNGKNCVVFETY